MVPITHILYKAGYIMRLCSSNAMVKNPSTLLQSATYCAIRSTSPTNQSQVILVCNHKTLAVYVSVKMHFVNKTIGSSDWSLNMEIVPHQPLPCSCMWCPQRLPPPRWSHTGCASDVTAMHVTMFKRNLACEPRSGPDFRRPGSPVLSSSVATTGGFLR